MPKILIVAATAAEVKPLCEQLQLGPIQQPGLFESRLADVLVTGVGMVNTAYHMGRHATDRYDVLINAGVCGAFDRALSLGETVHVVSDLLSEMGAEDGEGFIPFDRMGLEGTHRYLGRPGACAALLQALPAVSGVTQNKVHGHEDSIARVVKLYAPQVESMEGAAFLRGCEGVAGAYFQLRSVSNYVERRDKSKWQLPLAVQRLNGMLGQLIHQLQA